MYASLSNSLGLSSALNITEEAMVTKKQGIVSILGSDTDQRPIKAASLRRTLSADMSSKKWLTQHSLKKIASSEEFPVSIIDSSSEDGEEDYEERKETEARSQFDIWTSIQQEKNKKEVDQKPGQFDIWSSIISQKAEEESSKSVPPPYIHPLVQRSASSLSKKSLEICTESLGSETGSDGFSSYPPSETGDMEEDKEEDQELQPQKQERVAQLSSFDEEPRIVKYNYDVAKKLSSPSFPPPIPSLSLKDGARVRMKTHRDNGRLVLEAVSVPSQNNFLAQRQDGRLVLTFSNYTPSEAESEVYEVMNVEEEVKELEELEEEFECFGEEEFESFGEEENESEIDDVEEEEEESESEIEGVLEDRSCEMEHAPKLSSVAMNVHRLAVMMNKPIWLASRNPTWPKNFDEIVKLGEEKQEKAETTTPPPLAQSLPLRPRVARLIPSTTPTAAATATASLNAYEYYWRRPNQPISKAAAVLNPLAQQSPPLKDNSNKNLMANEQQQLLVLRGNKGDYFVPLLKGCKEPRRSLLFWEHDCIATS
ncbi:hypothetical protein REPUB_Repub11eG0125600 [Reevesia pubescens]